MSSNEPQKNAADGTDATDTKEGTTPEQAATFVIDESVMNRTLEEDTQDTTDGTQPVHPMPEHFPEVHMDENGKVVIKSDLPRATGTAATVASAPAESSATVAAPAAQPTVAVQPAPRTPIAVAADDDPHSVHDAHPRYQAERNVCIRCGSSNLTKGYVVDFSEKFSHIHFAPKRMTPRRLNSLMAIRPFRSLARLDAVACRDCGAVLLTVDPSELRRVERRRDS